MCQASAPSVLCSNVAQLTNYIFILCGAVNVGVVLVLVTFMGLAWFFMLVDSALVVRTVEDQVYPITFESTMLSFKVDVCAGFGPVVERVGL